ncbi:(deoxy)nucleoside triphosphate pyrophosphohydrolase [Sphingobacterium oryzagri]|uniref:8-oxo-dGTP diphosphatase n=1 Tax=Sphingobacterium oryzagri TaxID=3025669 RepID=A0ABY7WDD8_9SPHI|nr:(deoxy)nucleoside triphosphate pyrophosphohydrolase [Sphingobacterium sp. KACC 22765]WDF67669.1 (deoxy)nucleoside triphosphate pyrophosphohydrolase [Sphingobacterium sp. KACC 22765]
MLHVTCGIIEQAGKILICQRSSAMSLPLKWEFPGGKVEANESEEACLKREINEELGLLIQVGTALDSVIYAYPTFTICLHPYHCTWLDGDLHLREHAQARWVLPENLLDFDWAAADLPIVHELMKKASIT